MKGARKEEPESSPFFSSAKATTWTSSTTNKDKELMAAMHAIQL
jgi:hypothetical protein